MKANDPRVIQLLIEIRYREDEVAAMSGIPEYAEIVESLESEIESRVEKLSRVFGIAYRINL